MEDEGNEDDSSRLTSLGPESGSDSEAPKGSPKPKSPKQKSNPKPKPACMCSERVHEGWKTRAEQGGKMAFTEALELLEFYPPTGP